MRQWMRGVIIPPQSMPQKSWNLSEDHGRSWKSNMVSENKKEKKLKTKTKTDESVTDFKFSRTRHKHTF